MKNVKKMLAILLMASIAIYCLVFPANAGKAVSDGVKRCLESVIPPLYAMMAVSGILIRSGIIFRCGKYLTPVSRILFGINGECTAVFLFSLTAGYPVGAKIIYTMYNNKILPKRFAELLSGVCFGSGTAFIFGCITSDIRMGTLILVSTVSANVILLLILSIYFRRFETSAGKVPEIKFSADMLTDCVSSAGRTMGELCFMVTAFAVFSAMLSDYGIIPKDSVIIRTVFDITSITELDADTPLTAGLLSFGGICVLMQISSIFRGNLSILPLAVIRITASMLSYVICRFLIPVFLAGETVTANLTIGELHKASSPVPSVLLVIMTAVVIWKSSENKKAVPERTACKQK
ncbi:MAG: hypothetical protein K2N49_03185 [Ruminococcus sp.]|nr:hypothetical protein [Ruminococcus sp.]MDE7225851.1 hypothetical protein [Ruminococcus sp.]